MQLIPYGKAIALTAAIAGLLIAAGCSTVHKHHDAAASEAVAFPDPTHSTVPEGTFVNLENLRKVAPGMTKKQLYALLGTPHFSEGVFGVKKWNYIFDFRKNDGSNDYVRCQYQIVFDQHHLLQQVYWKPEACSALLDEPRPAPPPAPIALPSEPIRLSSDALFDFDRAELTASGRQQLDKLLAQVRSASQIEIIHVIGYTDRIGSDSYNLDLSKRRAQSVRDYLASGGVSVSAIQVEGRGKADPLVQCADTSRDKLIACLAPNRRVELSGTAKPSSE